MEKIINSFKDSEIAKKIVSEIHRISTKEVRLMEVCGTHTVSIFRTGIKDLLPPTIKLLSGPGCPVCVTSNKNIDEALEAALLPDVILTTFGDMLRVPGSKTSLAEAKAEGADVRIVYSTMDAVDIAKANPDKEVVFFGIGFETTAPTVAAAILKADREGIKNFSIIGTHKLIPEAMRALITDQEIGVQGFICPGHVSAIIGLEPYLFIAEEYGVPSVITGFEPVDLLQGILMLVKQIENGEAKVEIQYSRGVKAEGNPVAREMLYKVFEIDDSIWRGIGVIPNTGLKLRPEYQIYDSRKKLEIDVPEGKEHPGCICGAILRGVKTPLECNLFGKVCLPERPIGACMVSVEGTCAAYYKYGSKE